MKLVRTISAKQVGKEDVNYQKYGGARIQEARNGAAGRDFVRSERGFGLYYDGSTSKCEATHSVFGSSFLPSIFSIMKGTLTPALVTGNNRNAESMSG